jgi:hypothetical protein
MPPVIFAAVIGAGLYAGYRLFTKLVEQARTPPKTPSKTAGKGGEPKNLGGLEWDDQAGAYRPMPSGKSRPNA